MLIRRTAAVAAALSAAALASAALGTPSAAAAPIEPAKTALDLSSARHTLAALGTGSAAHAAPWQVCGSAAVAGAGLTVDHYPSAVLGDCANANAFLWQRGPAAAITALTDSAILAAPWQLCASDAVAGVGATASINADKVVRGDCDNANVRINAKGDDGYHTLTRGGHRPYGPPADHGLVSVGAGSAVQVAAWQACGSTAVLGAGATVAANSDHLMYGDCHNANAQIGRGYSHPALASVLDNSHVSVASWQVCGSTAVGGVGAAAALNSANVVYGSCSNANTVID